MDKWDELKQFIVTQHDKIKDDTGVGKLLKGFYKTIKDKMWSLERKEGITSINKSKKDDRPSCLSNKKNCQYYDNGKCNAKK